MDKRIPVSWSHALKDRLDLVQFHQLMDFVNEAYAQAPNAIFPPKNEIFRALELCPFDQVKVVILGQDPYPTKGHAHGLCFSCDASVYPLPKSLQNIFKELASDLTCSPPSSGDLSHWAEQGVLLLNNCLSVQEGHPLSHANKGWEEFTDTLIQVINEQLSDVVFVLWGKPAQQKAQNVDNKKHAVLIAPHPSPLSAYRGFFGSKPFSTVNSLLEKSGNSPINWVNESINAHLLF
ncbi:MAG: uracil-DNA glycosylase [Fluviicola sp.]|nr:uracil-DNA glycosylase [Fluviicola sp.]MBP6272353.1 uracil-DNA glycosylase [Fluviicola sp.]